MSDLTIKDVFENVKETENGDISFSSTGNNYSDLLFFAEEYTKQNTPFVIGTSEKDKLFSMLMRDPRFGLGYRKYGRALMEKANVSFEDRVNAGRFDDLLYPLTEESASFLKKEIENGNELAKKWMPRFSSSKEKKILASKLAKMWGIKKQEYNKFVKVTTTESLLTEKDTENINFSHVPSLASIKYAHRFSTGDDTKDRYLKWIDDVKNGKAKLNISTSTPYDIYKNRHNIDADLFFDKLEKIKISCIPIIDSSGSMQDSNDSFGKAASIGHYLAKCSTYLPNNVISFSSKPTFLDLEKDNVGLGGWCIDQDTSNIKSQYCKEIARTYTGDCSNTDFTLVMELLKQVNKFPDYIVVLSDMEFDCGSNQSIQEIENLWKSNNCHTKIVWWNLNSRNKTAPEMDSKGNIYMTGYSPFLLKFLSVGFNGEEFINELIENYKNSIGWK